MAAIDKTYVSNWEDYRAVVDWCKKNEFICPNGMKITIGTYEWNKEYFEDVKELPVLNTNLTQDYFLIKYCPLKVVQDRMRAVYGDVDYNNIKNGTSDYDTFVRPDKISRIRLIEKPEYYEPVRYFSKNGLRWIQDKYSVSVDLPEGYDGYAWYNEDYNQWVMPDELGYFTCNNAILNCKTWKALVRRIRSWHLPVGTIINVSHLRLTGGDCKFVVTK